MVYESASHYYSLNLGYLPHLWRGGCNNKSGTEIKTLPKWSGRTQDSLYLFLDHHAAKLYGGGESNTPLCQ